MMDLRFIIAAITYQRGDYMYDTVKELRKSTKGIIEFRGYNHNTHIADGECYDMQNLSSDLYPVMSPRKSRNTVASLSKINGLYDKNGLIYVNGADFYYNGEVKFQVADSPKQFASMGAYVIIFPDKFRYNTETGVMDPLEAYFSITATVSVTGCTQDGTAADASTSVYAKIAVAGIGSNFKQYDGITITSSFAAINKTAIVQAVGADYIVIPAKIGTTQSLSSISVTRRAPDMDFIVEQDNRLWGCSSSKHEIYASKLGDPTNWNCFEGISTDSYAVTVGSDGDFTGAKSYLGYVLFFKEDCIHKIYGSKPSNYQVFTNACRGLAKGSERSLAIVNETLYYMSRNGIMAYEGSIPESVSDALGDIQYSNGVAGAIGNKYYISMSDGSKYHLFVFDEKIGQWHREDNTQAKYFTYYNNKLYFATIGNKLIITEENTTENIPWYAEFSEFSELSLKQKYVSKLGFRFDLDVNALMDIEIMYGDSGLWEKIATFSGKMKKSDIVNIQVRRCDYYKIRLSGVGKFKLYMMSKTYIEGSDIHGRV